MYHLKRKDKLGSEIFEVDGSIKKNYNDQYKNYGG